jgi:hypothetical protein
LHFKPGIGGDELDDVGGGDGVDGVVHNVDDAIARLNVCLLNLGSVDGDRRLKYKNDIFLMMTFNCNLKNIFLIVDGQL